METQLQYKLPVFEGPLDLLLTLISKNKIDIYDIQIADLLDQYMEQIDRMQEKADKIVNDSVEYAKAQPQPVVADLEADVYAG